MLYRDCQLLDVEVKPFIGAVFAIPDILGTEKLNFLHQLYVTKP